MPKHPHDALIRAYLDGKAVQYLEPGSDWRDIEPADTVKKFPHFYADRAYRLKPVTIRYRVALLCNEAHYSTATVDNLEGERRLSANSQFVRWLTDWIEVKA